MKSFITRVYPICIDQSLNSLFWNDFLGNFYYTVHFELLIFYSLLHIEVEKLKELSI